MCFACFCLEDVGEGPSRTCRQLMEDRKKGTHLGFAEAWGVLTLSDESDRRFWKHDERSVDGAAC